MNKRIQELAKQAGFYADKYGHCLSHLGDAPSDADDIVDLEEFAKLIIQSISNIDFRIEIGLTSDQDFDIRNLIKNHFEDQS